MCNKSDELVVDDRGTNEIKHEDLELSYVQRQALENAWRPDQRVDG